MHPKSITVAQLITHLQTLPQDALVGQVKFSEFQIVTLNEFNLMNLCPPRPDGWIHDSRPDIPTIQYLIISGN
jgi:hypothetical protein